MSHPKILSISLRQNPASMKWPRLFCHANIVISELLSIKFLSLTSNNSADYQNSTHTGTKDTSYLNFIEELNCIAGFKVIEGRVCKKLRIWGIMCVEEIMESRRSRLKHWEDPGRILMIECKVRSMRKPPWGGLLCLSFDRRGTVYPRFPML